MNLQKKKTFSLITTLEKEEALDKLQDTQNIQSQR